MALDPITHLDRLKTVAGRWEKIHARDSGATVFTSWPWIYGRYAAWPGDWIVLGFRPTHTGPYQAFLPLRWQHPAPKGCGQLTMGGSPWADYTGFVCSPGHEDRALHAFAQFIGRHLPWDTFEMTDVRDPRLCSRTGIYANWPATI